MIFAMPMFAILYKLHAYHLYLKRKIDIHYTENVKISKIHNLLHSKNQTK